MIVKQPSICIYCICYMQEMQDSRLIKINVNQLYDSNIEIICTHHPDINRNIFDVTSMY